MIELLLYISLGIHLGIYFLIFLGWLRIQPQPEVGEAQPISVIIAAWNEAENLKLNLPYVLNQSYGAYEVIVVLDRCSDDSLEVIEELQQQFPQLRSVVITEVPEGWAPKKYALDQGIKQAQHEWLAFTDADCRPETGWLTGIAAFFSQGANLILGASPYRKEPGLLNSFIRFETLYTLFQYVGLARMGMPYMGVGRNLAYRKSHFESHAGLDSVKKRLSGDDDLLVNHFANPAQTAVMIKKGTRVESDPKTTFKGWLRQKVRHVSASSGYKPLSQFILATFHGAHAIFYVSLIVYFCVGFQWEIVLALFSGNWILKACLMGLVTRRWKIRGFSLLFPLHDFLFFVYNLALVPTGLLVKPKWR